MTSLWRKKKTSDKVATDVHHNEQNPSDLVNILTNSSIKSEQKHDNLSDPLDLLHQENVRLGLYEDVYDLSIKSDNLSIKSWVGLTDEEIGMAFRAVFPVGSVVFTNGATEFAQTIERKLKEKNT
jgi:hypothetical protein